MSERPEFSLIIGYASDMGTAEYIAMQLADAVKAVGIDATETELNDIPLDDVAAASHFIVVASTFGEGEVPDNGTVFWEELSASGARLDHLRYAVLALGDTSYELYCNAGRIFDARLAELGAHPLADRVEFDCYREGDARDWIADIAKLLEEASTAAPGHTAAAPVAPRPATTRNATVWTDAHPYAATAVVNRLLTATESDKEVRHIELDLGDSGITYDAGDSVAVHPVNAPGLVEALVAKLGVDDTYVAAGADVPLVELLANELEICAPSRALQALVAARTDNAETAAALNSSDPAVVSSWLYGRDVLDLLDLAELAADEVLEALRPLQFRDYSIASSPLVHPGQLHLTVATVRYHCRERARGGVASTFLADQAASGQSVRIHLRPNHNFRLPAPNVPIIMIGPGTGIAPFRAFLHERQATAAPGRAWLFFGDRRRATDFLYGDELSGFVESGALTRLDLAFSREADGPKTYVQHQMKDNAADLFGWLQDGAYLYVCGDADRMAKDVDRTLHEIVAEAGGMDAAAAHGYVNELIKAHRYLRDVY
ncbi:sulfite reductase flavoprotein subunit alpha [Mycobacterium sp. RTGN5]|uniref:diflavin oxidoreductase n=1 Tax=Mycobacterium sp. RTGN5 TaxID=3016522 RepID=UPI0029C86945|nr:sulfite reductase flavoprotein subunit alpha [Mycobacterium sp. RTGN5]